MSFPSKDFSKFPQQKGGKPKRFYEKKLLPPTTSSHIAYKQKHKRMINCVDEMKRWFIMRSVELKVYASI